MLGWRQKQGNAAGSGGCVGMGEVEQGPILPSPRTMYRPCKVSQKIQSRATFGSCHTVGANTLSVLDLEAKKTTQRGFIWSLLTAQTHRGVKFWRRERWRRWEADCVPSLLGVPNPACAGGQKRWDLNWIWDWSFQLAWTFHNGKWPAICRI